ncbi:hypothetical protein ACA097_05595 [Pseudomonas sp. QL9]|uniref:hypothetical protein n=1 Tax=Pseudomonas sp. QL9 TaxID=3242725 RepID=UPI00352A59D1
MSFRQNRRFWTALAIISPLLLIFGNYKLNTMMSEFKQDFGNGVVVYADKYVKTGRWVFDCNNSRLISREPLPAPISELESAKELAIGNMFYLNSSDQQRSQEVLRAIVGMPGWYKNLRYLYSALDEDSDLNSHMFYFVTQYAGQPWAVEVDQSIGHNGKSSFEVTARPYAPETYVDYTKALQAAAKSCPAPQ